MNDVSQLEDIDPDLNFNVNGCFNEANRSEYLTVSEFINMSGNGEISILNYNIRSFNRNIETFEAFIFSLHEPPTIIVLCETWFVDPVDISGYKSFHTVRYQKRGGGVSVYFKHPVALKRIDQLSYCDDVLEMCSCELLLGKFKIILLATYRPPSASVSDFIDKMNNILSYCRSYEKICLLGDININLMDDDSVDVINFSSLMRSFHLMPLITKPTRFPPSSLNQAPHYLIIYGCQLIVVCFWIGLVWFSSTLLIIVRYL